MRLMTGVARCLLLYVILLLLPAIVASQPPPPPPPMPSPFPDLSCTELFGSAPDFVLCEETETTCSFNTRMDGGTCDQMCASLGSTCVGAINNGESCEELPDNTDTCETSRSTEICICERPEETTTPPPTLILNSVGTFNGEAAPEQAGPQTSFAPGEAIRYVARIKNTGSSTMTASLDYLVTGPKEIFSSIDDIAIPPDPPEGGWSLYVTTTVPTDAPSGTYTLRVTMTINGQSSTKESSFTVLGGSEQPPAAPSNVQVEEIAHEGRPSTKVSWTDNADNELGYVVVDQNRPQEYEADPVAGVGSTGSIILPFVSDFCVYAYNDYGISDAVCTGDVAEFKFPWESTKTLIFTGGPHAWIDPERSGIDFSSGSTATKILAAADGTVFFVGNETCLGNRPCRTVKIRHTGGLETWYVHLSNFSPSFPEGTTNKQVFLGQWIGNEGSHGADNIHLHMELRLNDESVSWDGRVIDGWTVHEDCDGYNQAANLFQKQAPCIPNDDYQGYISRSSTQAVPMTSRGGYPQFSLPSTNVLRE